MSDILSLKDFERWKIPNKDSDFGFYDYLFHVMRESNVSTDAYFAFVELFWPTVIQTEGFYLLKEQFSKKKLQGLLENNQDVEYWMNLLTVDSYFDNDPDRDEKAAALSQILAQTWDAKLKRDFPDTDFVVKYLYDEEVGDYGLTFYQK